MLFLGEVGPVLHGKQWELTDDDARALRRVAGRPSLRAQPALEPAGFDSTGRRHAGADQEIVARP